MTAVLRFVGPYSWMQIESTDYVTLTAIKAETARLKMEVQLEQCRRIQDEFIERYVKKDMQVKKMEKRIAQLNRVSRQNELTWRKAYERVRDLERCLEKVETELQATRHELEEVEYERYYASTFYETVCEKNEELQKKLSEIALGVPGHGESSLTNQSPRRTRTHK